ncbi:hypothetical protein HOLleu_26949 [Holothuria leucospilota]|uniref:MAPEG family protein n=1 Tax=Holothuria leucospilota TaxID=206669 RepID=A0A9Q1BPP6_HOLLE|nr:hypothetical protein HOLleu_26949 [Holothuria leucospilota]
MHTNKATSDRDTISLNNRAKSDQKRAIRSSIASWTIVLVSSYLAVYHLPIPTPATPSLFNRFIFTSRLLVFAVLPIAFGIFAIMHSRFNNMAAMGSNPVNAKGSYMLSMVQRYLLNTMEQTMMFVILQVTLSTLLSAEGMALIPMYVFLFVVSRFLFFVGYMDAERPVNRAFGYTMTLAVNVYSIFMCLFLLATKSLTFEL